MRTMPLRLLVLLAAVSAAQAQDSPPDLAGEWVGTAEVNGQAGSFVIHAERGGDGALAIAVSMPPIEAWHIPVGQMRVEGNRAFIGPVEFTYDAESDTLSGNIPHFFLPVYEVPVVFRRDRPAPKPVPNPDYGPEVEPTWTVETDGAIYASPLAIDDRVYVGSDDGHLYAVDAASGDVAWKAKLGARLRTRVTAIGRDLLIPTDDGHLYRVDRTTGSVRWKVALGANPTPRSVAGQQGARYDHFASAAVVDGAHLYIGTLDGEMLCLDTTDGRIRWRFAAGDAVQSTAAVANGRVYFGSFDQHVYALDAETGELAWKFDTGAAVPSSPAVVGEFVVIGSRSYDLYALDAKTGEPRWRDYYWYSWVESSARVADGSVYIGSSDAAYLLSLDAKTGERQWSFDTGGSSWGQPAVSDDSVYVGAVGVGGYIADHQPGFFAVDRETGAARWSYRPERPEGAGNSGFASSPALGAERVFVGGLDGRLYAFRR